VLRQIPMTPSFFDWPMILMQPHHVSRVMRSTSSGTSSGTRGRPGRPVPFALGGSAASRIHQAKDPAVTIVIRSLIADSSCHDTCRRTRHRKRQDRAVGSPAAQDTSEPTPRTLKTAMTAHDATTIRAPGSSMASATEPAGLSDSSPAARGPASGYRSE